MLRHKGQREVSRSETEECNKKDFEVGADVNRKLVEVS